MVPPPSSSPLVVLAFSGGLDTTFCAVWLAETLGARVATVTVDTGGFDAAELAAIEARACALGVVAHRTVDGRGAVFDRFLLRVVQGHALRGGVYPLSVACERAAQAEAVVAVARELGAHAIAHGSTGAGNDQVRFDVALAALAPDLAVHAPIRQLGWSREQERAWLAERGLEIPARTVRYSINAGLCGTTIGGGEIHDPWQAPAEEAWTTPVADPPPPPAEVVVGFEAGRPVSLDGAPLPGPELVAALEARCREHGVGRGLHVGDTILGLKGRVAFEAGAPLVLVEAHRALAKLVLTKWQQHWLEQAGSFWGMLLHEGLAYDPVMADLEALLDSANARATGEVRVRLHAGAATAVGARSPWSLFDEGAGRYGEGATAWTGEQAAGFARLHGLPSVLAARRDLRVATPATVTAGARLPAHTSSDPSTSSKGAAG